MIYLIFFSIILIGLVIYLIKSNIKKSKELKDLKFHYKQLKDIHSMSVTTENKKTEIREEANEQKQNINNNPGIDHNVLPVSATKHSETFSNSSRKSSRIDSKD